jgi:hypothetical protein
MLMMALVLTLGTSGCSGRAKEAADTESVTEEEVVHNFAEESDPALEDIEYTEDTEEAEDAADADVQDEKPTETQVSDPVTITVYHMNDDATDFVSEEVTIDLLSPEKILSALAAQDIISSDAAVRSFEIIEEDGEQRINLDMNEAYLEYVGKLGSTGEYYAIGSLCNTFLDAYQCDCIKITIAGQELDTGHSEYPNYMYRFS